MNAAELDRVLAGLRARADNATANLLELESLPTVVLLQHATLHGESQHHWSQARARLADVWRWSAQLSDLLDRADDRRRGRRQNRAMTLPRSYLLLGPSIDAVIRPVPLTERTLVDADHEVRAVTPDELVGMMAVEYQLAHAVVTRIAHVWEVLAPTVHAAMAEPGIADGLLARLRGLRQDMADDPLSVDEDDVDRAIQDVERTRRERAMAADLRDHLAERLDATRRLVADLEHLEREVLETRRRTIAKIAQPPLPPRTVVGGDLHERLESIARDASRGAWQAAAADLDAFGEHLRRLRVVLVDERDSARRPVDDRDRLRGLLGASQAQARRVGLAEDAHLHICYEAALESLTSAPTDLDDAATLVDRYRAELAERRRAAS